MTEERKRVVFLDYLRVVACFMVMAIHSCEPFYLGGEAPNVTHLATRGDLLWVTVVECICRVCVPLFVVTSSYLLFPLRTSTACFIRRRLVRIVIPFAIWSAAYVWWFGGSWGKALFNFPDEGGHLWFVPMLLGLYLAMPLLSPWAEKVGKAELRGWILLWFATTLFPFLRRLWTGLYGEPSFGAIPYIWGECPWNAFGTFHYVSGFLGYMLIGLWFRKFAPVRGWGATLRVALPMWIAGVAAIGVPFFLSVRSFPFSAPYAFAVNMEMSIEYCSAGVALASVAAFMAFRKLDFAGWFHKAIIRPISEASYGMYLIHMFALLAVFPAMRDRFATPFAILFTAIASFAISAFAAIVVRRVPFVGKWICG